MTGLAKADWPLRCLDYTVAMETGVKVLWISSYTDILHITSVLMTGYFTCWPIHWHQSYWFTGCHRVREPLWWMWGAVPGLTLLPCPFMCRLQHVDTKAVPSVTLSNVFRPRRVGAWSHLARAFPAYRVLIFFLEGNQFVVHPHTVTEDLKSWVCKW